MVSFKSFIQAIQDATLGANDALMDKNMEVLNRYFYTENEDDLQERIDDALDATQDVLDPNSKVTKQSLKDAVSSIKSLRRGISQSGAAEQLGSNGDLHPKTVTLNYPTKDKDGNVTSKEVHVPLVTLVPIAFSQVDELRLTADLELSEENDEIQISLGKYSGGNKAVTASKEGEPITSAKRSIGNVEIVIKPQEMSDGMQHVVDAYEKVLKAQLPL